MALEDALRELTAATVDHNELLKQVLGKADAKTKTETKAAAKSDDADAGDAAEEKPARKPRARKTDGDDAETKPAKAAKGPTTDDAVSLVTGWLGEIEVETDDEGEPLDDAENQKLLKRRNARKAFVKKCLAKLDVEKVGEITEAGDIKKFIGWIESKKAGDDPFESDED